MGSFILGLLGGFTAWAATEYFARPLARFYAMRARTAEALARYENRQHLDQDLGIRGLGLAGRTKISLYRLRRGPCGVRHVERVCYSATLPISLEKVSVLCAVCGIELAEHGGNRTRYRGERILSCAGGRRLKAFILA